MSLLRVSFVLGYWFMKKVLWVAFVGLFYFSFTAPSWAPIDSKKNVEDCIKSGKPKKICEKNAYGWGLNEYLANGYKITSEEFRSGNNWVMTLFILKRKRATAYYPLVITCHISPHESEAKCVEP